jgi:hypothetical protein
MKKTMIILFFIPNIFFGQAKLKAQLIDYSIDIYPPSCSNIQTTIGLLKFKVLEKYQQLKLNDTIIVRINCPREKLLSDEGLKLFKNGNILNLKLSTKINDSLLLGWRFFSSDKKVNFPVFEFQQIED